MESQPGRFEYLPHTADAKFRAYGRTIDELFRNAAVAMFEIITETEKVAHKLKFTLELRRKRLGTLLFDFLDELLFLLDTEGFLLHECTMLTIGRDGDLYRLRCVAAGDRHKGYDVSCNVKAVTYNDMYIWGPVDNDTGEDGTTGKKDGDPGAWECQVVVDL